MEVFTYGISRHRVNCSVRTCLQAFHQKTKQEVRHEIETLSPPHFQKNTRPHVDCVVFDFAGCYHHSRLENASNCFALVKRSARPLYNNF